MSNDLTDFLEYQRLLTEKEPVSLEYIQITIEPRDHSNSGEKMLKIRVITNGERRNIEMLLAPDEFERVFDLAMDRAREEIKAAIKRHKPRRRN